MNQNYENNSEVKQIAASMPAVRPSCVTLSLSRWGSHILMLEKYQNMITSNRSLIFCLIPVFMPDILKYKHSYASTAEIGGILQKESLFRGLENVVIQEKFHI